MSYFIKKTHALLIWLLSILFCCLLSILVFDSSYAEDISHEIVSKKFNNEKRIDSYFESEWNRLLKPYLEQSLWIDRDMYDAAHVLMVPLHFSFLYNRKEWQNDFTSHIKSFFKAPLEDISQGRLNRLHYFYLLSQYVVLNSLDSTIKLNEKIYIYLYNEISNLWTTVPAWQWGRQPFSSLRDRIQYKLNTKHVEKSFYRAIIDEEHFVFAIAADLNKYLIQTQKPPSAILDEILSVAFQVYSQETYLITNSKWQWMFQPGVWKDHPEYKFAGTTDITNPQINLAIDIVPDVSHSARFPLWLTSLSGTSARHFPKRNEFYNKLLSALEKQLVRHVLVMPDASFKGIRTMNYMDGSNGLYRWDYATIGVGGGYKPYQLSGTFLYGWWSFLKTDSIAEAYKIQTKCFPLNINVTTTYTGPNTTRERNPLVVFPDFFENGFAELLSNMAVEIASSKKEKL